MKKDTVEMTREPITKELLKEGLAQLGVRPGMILEVHTKMSAFNYVIGGARTIVDALMETVGENGTILMPMHVSGNSEPSDWVNPPVQANLYKEMRNAIPPYDSVTSSIHYMGEVAANFKLREGVVMSNHPSVAYAAWGKYAKLLCNRQSLHFPLAEESPTARLYELKGFVLLLGADFDSVTCMHLAEYRTDDRPIKINGARIMGENGPEWKKYLDLDIDSDDFIAIGNAMRKKNAIREITLGGGRIQLFPAAYAIDEATQFFDKYSVFGLYRY